MFPFKRIVCPIDFSDSSKQVLRLAIRMAERYHAELIFISVNEYHPLGRQFEFNITDWDIEQQIHAALDDLLKKNVPAELIYSVIVKTGRTYHEICNAAVERKADLILLAPYGLSELSHILIGGTAERVVRFAPCPVLVVRIPINLQEWRHILYTSDFSDESRVAFPVALELVEEWKGILYILNVYSSLEILPLEHKFPDASQFHPRYKNLDLITVTEHAKSAKDGILAFIQEKKIDLVVMATHGYHGLKRMWLGSTAEEVVRRSPCPVLTVNSFKRD
jgi:nucleotide-binding universal stress UspA family protein